MVCANCKREIPETAQVCPLCGCPVRTAGVPVSAFETDAGADAKAGQPPAASQASYPPQASYVHQQTGQTVQPSASGYGAPQFIPGRGVPGQPPTVPQAPYPPQASYVHQQTGQVFQPSAYGYGAPQFIPGGVMPGQPPKKRTAWIVFGIVAGILVVAGIALAGVLMWYNSPNQVFDRAMEVQDYAAAGAQLDLLRGYERSEAVEQFVTLAEDAYWSYNMDAASYEETEELLSELYDCCPEDEMREILDDLETLYSSKVNFETGELAQADGDYDIAIYHYDLVIMEDSLYDTAQERLEEVQEEYKDEIIKRAKELADKGQYLDACDTLLEGEEVLGADSDIDELWEEYYDKAWETEMDTYGLAPSGKYKTIEDLVNSDIMQEQLDSIMDEIITDGVGMDLSGQGNKLIYTFMFFEDFSDVDTDVLREALDAELDEMSSVFEGVAASLKDMVEVEDPTVVVKYVTSDGTLLCSREFRAAE